MASSAQGQGLEADLALDARARLARYAEEAHWPHYQAKVQAWLGAAGTALPTCEQGLAITPSNPQGNPWGRVPYEVSCQQPAWTLRGRAEVRVTLPVWTAAHALRRGAVLGMGDLRRRPLPIETLHGGFVTDQSQLLEHRARRNLKAGQVLSPLLLAEPLWVKKGEGVLIRVQAQGVAASMAGTALEDGGKGELVKVRNNSSGKVLSALVVEKGVVETRF
ncbi:flagellar basal body P-ring formation chaperone FlgA [Gallaecimonas kandeliae]|uniref:flagellar basal body P-ring formation chaperone FlgA n=1 Tax=Gallaecimonas kandeliae TaxID=3029055 RepID=UPI0026489B65|nr:flagellar basal body P-ring formation chaperone FlgA [Gallaecimonas kandeliae]WKE66527.1 flagellar basal body P-ring formation chaperone FlgA [Gallaecimonas kandeliae]